MGHRVLGDELQSVQITVLLELCKVPVDADVAVVCEQVSCRWC